MKKIVVFTANNARVYHDPSQELLDYFNAMKDTVDVVKDPDLTGVIGVAPENWQLVDGHVVAKPGHENPFAEDLKKQHAPKPKRAPEQTPAISVPEPQKVNLVPLYILSGCGILSLTLQILVMKGFHF